MKGQVTLFRSLRSFCKQNPRLPANCVRTYLRRQALSLKPRETVLKTTATAMAIYPISLAMVATS